MADSDGSMSDDRRRNVERLHEELTQAAAGGDEHAQEMLDHVGAYLEREEPAEDDHENLAERLNEALVRFDTEHPSLAGAIQGVIDSLSSAGI
jgi:hypothetical protein